MLRISTTSESKAAPGARRPSTASRSPKSLKGSGVVMVTGVAPRPVALPRKTSTPGRQPLKQLKPTARSE
ncbi:MAG: hypothetical protein IPF99_38435 [Deltaproteobacteria bacterium]|nr:hypothetical protein [Deltaproteobacteria bacterium]